MKKIICITLSLLLILSMVAPVCAVTPDLDTPSISIPDISDDVHIEIPDEVFDDWFEEHPIEIPDPTEPPEEPEPDRPWCDWLHAWLRWWRDKIC